MRIGDTRAVLLIRNQVEMSVGGNRRMAGCDTVQSRYLSMIETLADLGEAESHCWARRRDPQEPVAAGLDADPPVVLVLRSDLTTKRII